VKGRKTEVMIYELQSAFARVTIQNLCCDRAEQLSEMTGLLGIFRGGDLRQPRARISRGLDKFPGDP